MLTYTNTVHVIYDIFCQHNELKKKRKIYKKIVEEVCNKCDGAKEFINNKIKELCFQEGILIDEVRTWFKTILFFIVFFASKTVCFESKTYKELKQLVFFEECYFLLSKNNEFVFWFYQRGLLCVW